MTIVLLISILLIVMEFINILFLYQKKEFSYQKIIGIVVKKNYVLLMVDKKERKILYENKTLYLDDKKRVYELIKDRGKIMRKNKKDFYEIVIKVEFSSKYKANDSINIIFPKKKYRRIEIFKKIIGGG